MRQPVRPFHYLLGWRAHQVPLRTWAAAGRGPDAGGGRPIRALLRPLPSLCPKTCRLLFPLLLACILVLSGAGCAPSGRAVGNTWKVGTADHDGVDRSNVLVGFIGAVRPAGKDLTDGGGEGPADGGPAAPPSPSAKSTGPDGLSDSDVLKAMDRDRMRAFYLDATSTREQEEAVGQAIGRRASLILIHSPGKGDWDSALSAARRAGIPVAIIQGPSSADKVDIDPLLFAARLTVGDDPAGRPLTWAIQTMVDDGRHESEIKVRLDRRDQGVEAGGDRK